MRAAIVTGVVICLLFAAATASAARSVLHPPIVAGATNSTSANWSGFDLTGGPFTSVSATWTQPTASCSSGETSYSSFWVGLDGDTSKTVEQIGTDSDCVNGSATYYAWYEMYPKGSGLLTVPLTAGDTISATVSTDGSGNFTLSLKVDNGTPATINARLPHATLSSAEVIAEAPSSNHGPFGEFPLTSFGTVTFTNAMVDNAPLATLSPDQITMVQNGTTLAQPSISNDDLLVQWLASAGSSGHGHGHQ
jgi:hypothetical protein